MMDQTNQYDWTVKGSDVNNVIEWYNTDGKKEQIVIKEHNICWGFIKWNHILVKLFESPRNINNTNYANRYGLLSRLRQRTLGGS